uniref:E3 ubiquitin-protein ligase TRIM71-like n=1 Tax=Saccoglossus kowalevskii TaxID=10224 RepID=A0ABM0N009_SACKO|nr:PREDICTED: E3 ubiquitin-protein ligase TRIM71-like [Saccoglossus kowalevskii]
MAAASVTVKSVLKEIGDDHLSCSICLEFYKNPKILPCLHTFCEQCLVDLKAKSGGVLNCPACRIQCDTPIQDVKPNFFVTSLLDTVQKKRQLTSDKPLMCETCQEKIATHRCVDCPQFCCNVCVIAHERIPALQSHKVLTIEEYKAGETWRHQMVQSKVFCSEHKGSHLEFYCDTCQVPVCLKCTIVNHRVPEHAHRNLQEVVEEYKTQLKGQLEQLKQKEKQLKKEKATAEATREKIGEKCEVEKKKVTKRATEIMKKVTSEKNKLIDALNENYRQDRKDAEVAVDEVELKHVNTVSTYDYLETLMHHGNAVHLLSMRTENTNRIAELVAMKTKQFTYNAVEFNQGIDLTAYALLGVVKSEACPSKCTVENIPKQLLRGESINLLITTRDSRGRKIIPCQDIKVKMRNPDASWEDIDVTDNNDGTCQVMIKGKMEGEHQVTMTIDNQHLSGSPLHIPVISGLVQTVETPDSERLSGITINKHGDFVTGDPGNNRVTIHDRDGNYKQSFTFTDQLAKPFRPQDVAISDRNEYFMTDVNNKQVVVSDENGKLIRKFRTSEVNNPGGIAINPVTKNVYVMIDNQHLSGSPIHIPVIRGLVQTVETPDSERLSGITINKHGDFVTADPGNNRVTIHDRDGNYKQSFTFTDQLAKPFGPQDVAISDDNEYFMTDKNNKQVVVSDENGKLIRKFRTSEVNNPGRIAINPVTKNVYVSDKNKKCIRKYTQDGKYINSFDIQLEPM